MLAHSLKSILTLIPEALPLVKKASIDKTLPLDSADSCIASALQLKYFEKVAYSPVSFTDMEKVASAVEMYNVGETVARLSSAMVKAASVKREVESRDLSAEYFLKEASFSGDISTTLVSERSVVAQQLYKLAESSNISYSDSVELYSGHAYFDKSAALKSLSVRYAATKNDEFVKIARVIVESSTDERLKDSNNLVKIANFVAALDEKEGLQFKGFNFYQEAFVKEAAFKSALIVKLAGQNVDYEKLEQLGKARISSYVGADVAKEMDSGPENFKHVLESLPLDTQKLILNMTKNV
jgi:hypothetical protein